ncbi:MAG: hypothetical protein ACJ0GC_04670 [Amylibacter sp.]
MNLTNLNTGQYSRIGGIIDWKTDWQTNNGFNFAALTQLNANTYFIDNNFYKNATPLAMIEARYPLKKTNQKSIPFDSANYSNYLVSKSIDWLFKQQSKYI